MRTLLLAAAVLVAVDASAQHNARYTLTGPATETGIAGTAGLSFPLHPPVGTPGVLHTLSLWQTEGRPCQVEAGFWTAEEGFPLSAGDAQTTDRLTYEEHRDPGETTPGVMLDCGTARQKRTVRAPFPEAEPAGDGTVTIGLWGHNGAAAIHGLRVCTGAGSPAIRGVRAFVSTLNAYGDGRVARLRGQADVFERPACQTWQPAQRCPAGQVATAATAFYGGDDTLVGLRLTCRAVDIAPLSGQAPRRR
ncbi:MAG: hypothetical protein AAF594_05875 [Bacteroidota bacterium]